MTLAPLTRHVRAAVSRMTGACGRIVRGPRGRICVLLVAVLVAIAGWIRLGPIDRDLLADSRASSIVVVDRDGLLLYETLSDGGTRSRTLTADRLPSLLVAADLRANQLRKSSLASIA